LVFRLQSIDASNTSATWQIVKRRVPFPQRDRLVAFTQLGQELSETPDTTGIFRSETRAAIEPDTLEFGSSVSARAKTLGRLPSGEKHFIQILAAPAPEILARVIGNMPTVDTTEA
jgi:hypothetical protein